MYMQPQTQTKKKHIHNTYDIKSFVHRYLQTTQIREQIVSTLCYLGFGLV